MHVALHAAMPRLGDVASNVARVASAPARDDELVVFPELFLTGYNIGDDVQRLAFTEDDRRLAPIVRSAQEHGVHIVCGAPHAPRKGITYNGALCIDPAGAMTWIHKRSLATFTTFREALFFRRGGRQEVWPTKLGSLGVGICYDLFFPEFQRAQASAGADVLLNISASPSSSRRFFEALVPARAIENACFSLYTNNVGTQDGLVFWGGAMAVGPRGEDLGRLAPYQEGIARCKLDPKDLGPAREFRPTLRDTEWDPEAEAAA